MSEIKRIALIAGNGKFPLFFAKAAKTNGVEVVSIALLSEADKSIEGVSDRTYWVNLGEAKKVIDILKQEGIRHAVMAGKVNKLTIIKESMRLDEEAKKIVSGVIDRKDDTLLGAVGKRLKDFGIELLDSTLFLKNMMPSKGVLTKKRPSREESDDIELGYKIAKEIGSLDIGQSVAIKKKAVIAVEAIEGTDEMIKRAGQLVGDGLIVVKVSKPDQDMRFDVPVVGVTTIESLKTARASVLAIEADKVLLLEKEEVVNMADRYRISIIAV